ncbi:MAG: glycosyltransferase family 2 protein [bacterium]|nr:glycosyltransferase family 2 protein [bacterium]
MKTKLLEIFPGALAWLTLGLLAFLSFKQPVWVAVFIIIFDCYWLCKTIFLYFHLQASFRQMRANKKINWIDKLTDNRQSATKNWQNIYHLIIFPMYKEPYEVIRESFLSLKNANYSKDKLIVVLAIEQIAGAAGEITAQKIKGEFEKDFFKFLITCHPANLPGEIAGKGANETWAIKEAKKLIIDPLEIPYENILVSAFDIDTQIGPEYFGILTYKFLTAEKPQNSSYQPVPLFTNNIYQAPALARLIAFSTTFWMMMHQSWPERLTTFSSHSMPFKALVEIGFWQTNVVSEDSRIFWQFFLHYKGDWQVIPLLYPVYMDANVTPSFWRTIKNLYKQQRRWAWGVENVPYILSEFSVKKISWGQKIYRGFHLMEDFHSWATNALIIFIFGWLPVLIGGANFDISLLSYNLPRVTSFIMTLASIGIVTSAALALSLLPPKPKKFKFRHYIFYLAQWILMPITLIIMGSFPALEAQTRLMLGKKFHLDFWATPKSRSKITG